MLKLEDEVHEFAEMTCNKMLASAGSGPFDVKEAFNCFTADVISQYAFGEPMGFVAQEGWQPSFATWVKSFFASAYMMRHNALARKMANVLPFMADYLGEDMRAVMKVMNVTIPGYISSALKNPSNGRVFAEVMSDTHSMTAEEKFRFNGEGFNFLLAGTETTAVRSKPPFFPLPFLPNQLTFATGHPNSLHIPRPLKPLPPLPPPNPHLSLPIPHLARSRKNPLLLGRPAGMSAHDARCFASQCAHRSHRGTALYQCRRARRMGHSPRHTYRYDEHD
jgi:hypothetical protein